MFVIVTRGRSLGQGATLQCPWGELVTLTRAIASRTGMRKL